MEASPDDWRAPAWCDKYDPAAIALQVWWATTLKTLSRAESWEWPAGEVIVALWTNMTVEMAQSMVSAAECPYTMRPHGSGHVVFAFDRSPAPPHHSTAWLTYDEVAVARRVAERAVIKPWLEHAIHSVLRASNPFALPLKSDRRGVSFIEERRHWVFPTREAFLSAVRAHMAAAPNQYPYTVALAADGSANVVFTPRQ